jgi:hypothetical protein
MNKDLAEPGARPMADLVRRLVEVRERDDLLQRLVGIGDRLCGGLDPLTIQEWRDLARELPGLSAVVVSTRANRLLDRELTTDLIERWRAMTALLEREVFAHLFAHVPPGLALEYRLLERIKAITAALAALKRDPGV